MVLLVFKTKHCRCFVSFAEALRVLFLTLEITEGLVTDREYLADFFKQAAQQQLPLRSRFGGDQIVHRTAELYASPILLEPLVVEYLSV